MKLISSVSQLSNKASYYLVYYNGSLMYAYVRVETDEGKPPVYLWYDVDDYVFLQAIPASRLVREMQPFFEIKEYTVVTTPFLDLGILDKSLYKLNKSKIEKTPARTLKCGCTKAPVKRKTVVRKSIRK